MPAKYAYLYREGLGYLHVKALGDGTQGSVSLVRSLRSNWLRVRKAGLYEQRYDYDPSEPASEWCPEHHQHDSKIHATMIMGYANGGDLRDLFDSFNDLELMVPEYLIWLYLRDMINALDYLHRENYPAITHKDFFGGNVLVAWPQPNNTVNIDDPAFLLPKFLLADLGMSEIHPFDDINDQSDIEVELARIGFSQDYDDLSSTAYFLMTGDESDRRGSKPDNRRTIQTEYSEELVLVAEEIFRCAEAVMTDSRVTLDHAREFVKEKLISFDLSGWDMDILRAYRHAMVKINQPDPEPMTFNSYESLMTAIPRPAGPWDVVLVNPETYEVLETVSQGHCGQTAHLTDSEGERVNVDGTRKLAPPIDDEQYQQQNCCECGECTPSQDCTAQHVAMIREGPYHVKSTAASMPSTPELMGVVKGNGAFYDCDVQQVKRILQDDPWNPDPPRFQTGHFAPAPAVPRKVDVRAPWIGVEEKTTKAMRKPMAKPKRTFKVDIPHPQTRGNVDVENEPVEHVVIYDSASLDC